MFSVREMGGGALGGGGGRAAGPLHQPARRHVPAAQGEAGSNWL